ncbi:ROK family transcriptional regulator [Compostimonas suwonensis]|uniref:Putative NBD/HSP70 family sugar kinase n=1 Tax=Compostimonas suwonensis TaxID=1048394 RepID=A0A2M9BC89_9MICO|nr:ROK family transcriptional regulator [Compostimonas suwonensis]PJJ55532.1 putative NBD/HSP70 family sugar kinase [Compostimonas suwonensis]
MARREQVAAGPGSRALIVDLIRSAGGISRVELTELTGLTQPAVSGIVRKLIADGVIRETGAVVSTRGKPRSLLELDSHAAYGIGMHVSPDTIICVATDTLGGVVARQAIAAVGPLEDGIAERIAELYGRFVAAVGLDPDDIVGLAVAVPGPTDVVTGRVPAPSAITGLDGVWLRDELEARLATRVFVDNDASLSAIGEFWSRNVSRSDAFATIYMDGGIGAGVVLDGSLLRGASSNTAELGHITVVPDGVECPCGNVGCLECYASPAAVAQQVRDAGGVETPGWQDLPDAALFDLVARSAVTGDTAAAEFVRIAADRLALATVTLVNLFDLDRIVLAGAGFAVAGSIFVTAAQERVDTRAFARALHPIRVELAIDPRDSAAIGAATLVLQSAVAPGHGPGIARG